MRRLQYVIVKTLRSYLMELIGMISWSGLAFVTVIGVFIAIGWKLKGGDKIVLRTRIRGAEEPSGL